MPGPQTAPRVLVIVPAWNEQDSIGDDGSRDPLHQPRRRRPRRRRRLGRRRRAPSALAAGAEVCRLPFNLGVGGAMRTGYRFALRHGYDVAVQIDADGQHDPRYLQALLVATRRRRHRDRRPLRARRRPLRRPRPAPVGDGDAGAGALAAREALASPTSPPGSGCPTGGPSSVFASHYPAEYLGDTVESLVIALRTGCTVTQVPVDMRSRTAGAAVVLAGAGRGLPRAGGRRARVGPRPQMAGGLRRGCHPRDPGLRRAERAPMSAVNLLGLAGSVIVLVVAVRDVAAPPAAREVRRSSGSSSPSCAFIVALFPVLLERATDARSASRCRANLLFFIASLRAAACSPSSTATSSGRLEERTRTLAEEVAPAAPRARPRQPRRRAQPPTDTDRRLGRRCPTIDGDLRPLLG